MEKIRGVTNFYLFTLDDEGNPVSRIPIASNGDPVISAGVKRVKLIIRAEGNGHETLADINALRQEADWVAIAKPMQEDWRPVEEQIPGHLREPKIICTFITIDMVPYEAQQLGAVLARQLKQAQARRR